MVDRILSPDWRESAVLTSVVLPDGTPAGGLLLDPGDGRLLLLFRDEKLQVGDRVVVPDEVALTVTGVEQGTLAGRPVIALGVRRAGPLH